MTEPSALVKQKAASARHHLKCLQADIKALASEGVVVTVDVEYVSETPDASKLPVLELSFFEKVI